MVEINRIHLTSNWSTLGNIDLKCIICTSFGNKELDVLDLKADNCVCLVNDSNDKSKAQLEIQANEIITDIFIISEAQIIEVFGINDEYLFTHITDFIDDWQGMAVYYSKISLPDIPVCKLKFTRTKMENRLWIYSAKFLFKKILNGQYQNFNRFNIDHISRLMKNSNRNNLNCENYFKQFLQFYLRNFTNNNEKCILEKKMVSNEEERESLILSNICRKFNQNVSFDIFSKLYIRNNTQEDKSDKQYSKEKSDKTFYKNNFEAYIDKKFYEVKNDILKEIDIKLNNLREESNNKLDKIISFLESEMVKIKFNE